jgi:hypothetical protein
MKKKEIFSWIRHMLFGGFVFSSSFVGPTVQREGAKRATASKRRKKT